jgi:flagellar basal body-associated protein FliL
MADEEKQEGAEDSKPKGSKKKLLFGGGGVLLLALAFIGALMAVPKKVVDHELEGPFVAAMFGEDLRVNLSGEGNKRFAILSLNVVYDAYDQPYYDARMLDAMYTAELKDAMLGIASNKTREEIVDKAYKPVFLEEIKQAAEPLLFPVYLGESKDGEGGPPSNPDKESGLVLGETPPTFRGRYYDHSIVVDAVQKTLQLDGEDVVTFEGDESDLELTAADETKIYVDVTGLAKAFKGEVRVGIKGKIRKVLWEDVLIQ